LTAVEEKGNSTIIGSSTLIHSPLDIVAKEVKQDERLSKQVYLTLLSTYTKNPINLAINAPTGEGKSYVVRKVAELFPQSDVIFLTAMTDKALFHRQGTLVIKDENGEYQPIESKIRELDSEIEDKQSEMERANDSNLKKGLKSQIKILESDKKDLSKSAIKLIDLNHKALIFVDTPKHTLLEAIMSLLSHDHYEVEYEFVDNFNGIKTRTNVLRGYPTVIFTAAIDYSKYQRWSEIQRRFIITNPKMTAEKYRESIKLMGAKYGLPEFVYEETIVSESQKNQAKEMVKELKEKILLISERNSPNSPNVFIPFYESLDISFPAGEASDVTAATRLYNYLTLLPLVNIDKRPRLVTRSDGNPILRTCPFATFDDLQESIYLMEYSNGVRPYILEWYNEVFLVEFNEKKNNNNDEEDDNEEVGLTTKELVDATFRIRERRLSTQQVYETYIVPLVNAGYIDKIENKQDKRSYIFLPVLNAKQKKLFDLNKTNNLSYNKLISMQDFTLHSYKSYLISKIDRVLRYSFDRHVITKLENHEGNEITRDELVKRYYKDPDQYFEFDIKDKPQLPEGGDTVTSTSTDTTNTTTTSIQKESKSSDPPDDKKNNIIKEGVSNDYSSTVKNKDESQQIPTEDIKSIQDKQDISNKLFDEAKSNNFIISEERDQEQKQGGLHLPFKCFYCDQVCPSNNDRVQHIENEHQGKLYYPTPEDFENRLSR
jgi:hypothetical protein